MGPISLTERNWLKAAAIVLGGIAIFWTIQQAEQRWRPAPKSARLVGDPVEASMRVMTLPHFIIAILFMTTSRSMRRARSWIWFAATCALGAALCWLFAAAGGYGSMAAQRVVLLYFLVHQFRDEAYFYVANGDAPKGTDPKRLGWRILVVPALMTSAALVIVAFGAALPLGDMRRHTETFYGGLEPPLRWLVGALPLLALAAATTFLWRRCNRTYPGGTRGLIRTHRPLFVVSAGILLAVLLEFAVQQRTRTLITLHVAAWYVFVMIQFGRRPTPDPAPKRFSWTWMRATSKGFAFLHIGLALLVLAGCAVAAFGYRNAPSLGWYQMVLSRQAFLYWTIMHITTSFVPKP